MPSMIAVAMTPAVTAPAIMKRSARALLAPCDNITTRGPAARGERTKNTPKPIMRHETDVPWILDKACRRTRGEIPSSVNAKVGAGEDENRIHVTKHVKGEIPIQGCCTSSFRLGGVSRRP